MMVRLWARNGAGDVKLITAETMSDREADRLRRDFEAFAKEGNPKAATYDCLTDEAGAATKLTVKFAEIVLMD